MCYRVRMFQTKFNTADRLPCFGCQMFKKGPIKLQRMYQTAHQNDGFNALRLNCSRPNLSCLCYDSKPAKLQNARWTIQLLNHLLAARSGMFTLLSRAIKHKDIHFEVLSLQNRKSFERFFCFFCRTLGISPKDLEGLKTGIAFIFTALACPCVIIWAHWTYRKIWFNSSRSYTDSTALVEFEWLTTFLCVFIRSVRVFVRET